MTLADTRSLQQIKSETEQTRAGLTDTVEQLKTSVAETASDIRHRISPDAIKAEVSGYVKSRGEQIVERHDRGRAQQSDAGGGGWGERRLSASPAGASNTRSGAYGRRGVVFRRLKDRTSRLAEGFRPGV